MSIEQALADNTAAIKALTAAFAAGEAPKGKKTAKNETQPVTETTATPVQPTEKADAKPVTAGQTTPAAGTASPETMKLLKEKCTKLANDKGRDAMVAALAKFGGSKIPEIIALGRADAFLAYVTSIVDAPSGLSDFE